MNIIFDNLPDALKNKHITLELDTFRVGDIQRTAYCVVEKVQPAEFVILDKLVNDHHTLMQLYRQQDWDNCLELITKLMGHFNNELDSFYLDLKERIETYQKTPPGDNWDGTRVLVDESSQ